MEFDQVLGELENLIMDATRVPLSSKCIIDAEHVAQLMDAIRTSLPRELDKAKKLIRDSERRINEANEERQRIIRQAEAAAEKMITEEEVYKQAQGRAEEILKTANDEANAVRNAADEYAQKTHDEALGFANHVHDETGIYVRDVFDYLETTLGKMTDALQQSKDALNKKMRDGN